MRNLHGRKLSLSLSLYLSSWKQLKTGRGGVVTATKQICRNSREKKRWAEVIKKFQWKRRTPSPPGVGGGEGTVCAKQGMALDGIHANVRIRRASFAEHVERTFNVSADAGNILHDPPFQLPPRRFLNFHGMEISWERSCAGCVRKIGNLVFYFLFLICSNNNNNNNMYNYQRRITRKHHK